MRVSRTRLISAGAAAGVTAVLTLGLTSAVASLASPAGARIDQCGQNLPRCGTPLVYRPFGQQLALQATATRAGTRVITAEVDDNQVLQDWTYKILGRIGAMSASVRRHLGVTAFDIQSYQSAWIVRLELTPMGRSTGLCTANVDGRLVLARCDSSPADTFIQTKTANGVRAIVGYFGLSMLQYPHVPGHHLAATGSYQRNRQVVFSTPVNSDLQYWYEVPRRPSPSPSDIDTSGSGS